MGLYLASANGSELDAVINGDIFKAKNNVNNTRNKSIQLLALEYGFYYGYKNEVEKFQNSLNEMESALNQINFAYLLINNNMMPPVVVEGDSFYEQNNEFETKEIKKLFRIVKPAELVSNVPTWRDYILIQVNEIPPTIPNDFKLENSSEKSIWAEFAKKGIEAGAQHARDELDYQYALLIRDYKGMLLARHLNDLNIISFSKIDALDRGIVIEDKMVNIGDVEYISSNMDVFNSLDEWKPLIRDSDILITGSKENGVSYISYSEPGDE